MFDLIILVPLVLMVSSLFSTLRIRKLEKANDELTEDLRLTEQELLDTTKVLRDLCSTIRDGLETSSVIISAEMLVTRRESFKSRAAEIVRRIDDLMKKGERVEAAGFLRQETDAIWDHVHDALRGWDSFADAKKYDIVVRFLRQRGIPTNIDTTARVPA